MSTSSTELGQKMIKNTIKFYCSVCHYNCIKKYDIDRHVSSSKHQKNAKSTNRQPESTDSAPKGQISNEHQTVELSHHCQSCNKSFTSRSGLWRHNQKCKIILPQEQEQEEEQDGIEEYDLKNMFLQMMKQNEEFKQIMVEQNTKLMEMANNQSITNNNNNNNINYNNNNTINNKFNLTVFLNETCKDAMNIQEFIDYVTVQHSDFENFGKMGYVEALTRIFLRNLMELEVHRRPIHCSDLKREVLYVKDNDVWTSDVSREKLIRTIKYIANKNVKQIPGWMDKNPDSKNTQTKLHDKYMRMLCFSMGAKTVEEDQEYYKKIIRNVAKEVCIDKAC